MFDGILVGSLLMGLLGAGLLVRTGPSTTVKFLATLGLIGSLLMSSTYLIADQLTGRGFDASIVFSPDRRYGRCAVHRIFAADSGWDRAGFCHASDGGVRISLHGCLA